MEGNSALQIHAELDLFLASLFNDHPILTAELIAVKLLNVRSLIEAGLIGESGCY